MERKPVSVEQMMEGLRNQSRPPVPTLDQMMEDLRIQSMTSVPTPKEMMKRGERAVTAKDMVKEFRGKQQMGSTGLPAYTPGTPPEQVFPPVDLHPSLRTDAEKFLGERRREVFRPSGTHRKLDSVLSGEVSPTEEFAEELLKMGGSQKSGGGVSQLDAPLIHIPK
jgi:hypothetical protein